MSSIVWLASYPKSGNTWMRAFLQNFLTDSDEPADINALDTFFANENTPDWYQGLTDIPLPELNPTQVCALRPQAQARISASRQGTVLVKTHNYLGEFEGFPLHNIGVTAGAIYVVRNPLDVVLSVADHFGFTLDEAIAFINSEEAATQNDELSMGSMLGSWSFHVETWTQPSDVVCVVRYEDLLEKPVKTFTSVLGLLRQDKATPRIKRAVANSSFAALKKQENKAGFRERSAHSKRFFREGRKNQWREVLSREQIQAVVDANREQMKRFGYLPKGY